MGETTRGAKRLGGKRPGRKRLAKRLGEEMVWGRNVSDSNICINRPIFIFQYINGGLGYFDGRLFFLFFFFFLFRSVPLSRILAQISIIRVTQFRNSRTWQTSRSTFKMAASTLVNFVKRNSRILSQSCRLLISRAQTKTAYLDHIRPCSSTSRIKEHCNIGTIGHVDHGKTTLTAAITKVK